MEVNSSYELKSAYSEFCASKFQKSNGRASTLPAGQCGCFTLVQGNVIQIKDFIHFKCLLATNVELIRSIEIGAYPVFDNLFTKELLSGRYFSLMKYGFTYILLLYVCLAHCQPMPQLDSTTIYCGVFKADSGELFQVTKQFEIKNVGDEPLIIQAGKDDGGEAYLVCQKGPVAPGESGICEFHYGSGGATEFTRRLTLNWFGSDGQEEILICFTGVKKYHQYKGPILKADQRVFHLDTVIGGENRIDSHQFYTLPILLVNVGDQPAILIKATTSDGGTMMSWPKDPIMPGDTAVCVFHYYYLASRPGAFSKAIAIKYNARDDDERMILMSVKGVIVNE